LARTRIKICGITSVEDALACVQAGADALGCNLVPSSKRRVTEETAAEIVRAVGKQALVVLVTADLDARANASLRARVGAGCLQLHGDEAPEELVPLLPHAYKAVRIGGPADVEVARAFPGEYLMVDAKVPGALGGTGTAFDWALVAQLATERRLVLAGGLTPDNVAGAVRVAHPDCVDVASGVEVKDAPRRKDLARIRAFVAAVRGADLTEGSQAG
jgi:phosphoribosylanthranilate isomerase